MNKQSFSANKYLLLIFLLVIIAFAFLGYKFRGAVPAVLPPESQPAANVTNDLGLNLAPNFSIAIFADNLDSPRDLELSPEGILLASIPSKGKIVALVDRDKNGTRDQTVDVITNLNRPHGLAFESGKLFIAEEAAVSRYSWDPTTFSATLDKHLFDLPGGGRHFTRTIAFNNSGQMFVSIGSTCDVCFEKHEWLAAVIVSDQDGNNPQLFAKGLRNSVFITINPETQQLWGAEMGRDFLGDNLPPDEINILKDRKDYGWPICYGNKIHDTQFDKNVYIVNPCQNTESSIYDIPAHSAPLGLTFINSPQFPQDWQGDLLVAYHGSWNRTTPVGYKVVRLRVNGDKVQGEEDFLSGFLPESAGGPNQAIGRPVDLTFGRDGNLYISDDKAGIIYRVWR